MNPKPLMCVNAFPFLFWYALYIIYFFIGAYPMICFEFSHQMLYCRESCLIQSLYITNLRQCLMLRHSTHANRDGYFFL